MDIAKFTGLVLSLETISKKLIESGYVFSTKRGAQEVGNHFYFDGLLKKGSISIQMILDSRGHYQLIRLNTFTHNTFKTYESREMFTEDDLLQSAAYDFPFPDGF
jgi:hypothetical protein